MAPGGKDDHPVAADIVAFRDHALALYSRPGVSEACLHLQDTAGLDVNLVLLGAWLATRGRCGPTPAGWRAAIAAIEPWMAEAVRPLRSLRRQLKSPVAAVPDPDRLAIRERILKLELTAEQVAQRILVCTVMPGRRGAGMAPVDPAAVIRSYARAAGRRLGPADEQAVAVIAAAAITL